MFITATELKKNLSKYLLLSMTQEIYITKNGKTISMLSNPYQSKVEIVKSLIGVIPSDTTLNDAIDERTSKI